MTLIQFYFSKIKGHIWYLHCTCAISKRQKCLIFAFPWKRWSCSLWDKTKWILTKNPICRLKYHLYLEGKTTSLEKIPQFTVAQTDSVVLFFTLQEGYWCGWPWKIHRDELPRFSFIFKWIILKVFLEYWLIIYFKKVLIQFL